MRLVNIKERMPTEEDADSTGEVVWIAICTVEERQKRYDECGLGSWCGCHLEAFKSKIAYDPDADEIFWLEVNPKPALPEVKSHIRKVEL